MKNISQKNLKEQKAKFIKDGLFNFYLNKTNKVRDKNRFG